MKLKNVLIAVLAICVRVFADDPPPPPPGPDPTNAYQITMFAPDPPWDDAGTTTAHLRGWYSADSNQISVLGPPTVSYTVTYPGGGNLVHTWTQTTGYWRFRTSLEYTDGGGLVGNSYVGSGSSVGERVEIDETVPAVWNNAWAYHATSPPTRWQVPDEAKPLWSVEDTTLTADVFREGVDMLSYKMSTSGGGTSSGAMTSDEFAETHVENVAAMTEYYSAHAPTEQEMSDAGDASRDAIEAEIALRPINTGFAVSETAPSPGSIFDITLPVVGTVNLDPAQNVKVKLVCDWIKLLVAWVVFGLFEWWCWTQLQEAMDIIVRMQQSSGNIIMGSGGQITALIAAGLISTIIFAVPSLYWALVDSGIIFNPSTNPLETATGVLGSVGPAMLHLLYLTLPIGTICTVLASMFLVRKGRIALCSGVAAAIRFVVPGIAVGLLLFMPNESEARTVQVVNGTGGALEIVFKDAVGAGGKQAVLPAAGVGVFDVPDDLVWGDSGYLASDGTFYNNGNFSSYMSGDFAFVRVMPGYYVQRSLGGVVSIVGSSSAGSAVLAAATDDDWSIFFSGFWMVVQAGVAVLLLLVLRATFAHRTGEAAL